MEGRTKYSNFINGVMIIKCPKSGFSRKLQNEPLQFCTKGQFIFFDELNMESEQRFMVSAPPHYNGRTYLKFSKILWEFFLHLWGDKFISNLLKKSFRQNI